MSISVSPINVVSYANMSATSVAVLNPISLVESGIQVITALLAACTSIQAAGGTPPFNVVAMTEYLRLAQDSLALVNQGLITSTQLLQILSSSTPITTPTGLTPSPEMASLVLISEEATLNLDKENRFLAGALVVLNVIMQLAPLAGLLLSSGLLAKKENNEKPDTGVPCTIISEPIFLHPSVGPKS